MIRELAFVWHVRKRNYALALAKFFPRERTPERVLWALYRLGMFATASSLDVGKLGWHGCVAQAVSNGACGRTEQARSAVSAFIKCKGASDHCVELALALAPYMPVDALQLVEGLEQVPRALLAALFLRTGRVLQAQQLLNALPVDALLREPELHLLMCNAIGGEPNEQLARLNAFLRAYGVYPLELLDSNCPPSPGNVAPAMEAKPMDGPLVSVLMTSFGTGARVDAAISSLLSQSYHNLELIVVDDASCDDTPQRIKAWAQRDGRIRLIELPRNVGTYAAKLIGLSEARGEFVTCHDSDDWSHPEKLARQITPLLTNDRLVCTVSNYLRIQDDGIFYARAVYPFMRMNPSSALFRRRRVLEKTGVWDCVRTGADSEFLARLKLVFGSNALQKINLPLSLCSHRSESLMTAAATGYSEAGMSPQRLTYWECWRHWHIETLASRRKPFIPFDVLAASRERPFEVPDNLRVRPEDVEACLHSQSIQDLM